MELIHVVGARPNFMKAAPVWRALSACSGVQQHLVHTGQHYDINMSDVFFQQLGLAAADINLQVGSGTQAQQTAAIMSRFEAVVLERRPDLVLVYGDVNSTVAAALVCAKLLVPLGHVEAGLRSFDRSMPEEINRVLTDQLSDLLFTPSADANRNLVREGIAADKLHMVGNVMIDTVVHMLPAARQRSVADVPDRYVLVTLHRPSNVDNLHSLAMLIDTLHEVGTEISVLFPVHPRTRDRMATAGLLSANGNGLRIMEPLPYVDFLGLQMRAAAVITDSGGIQEETTFLGVPCLTVRRNTERPVTVELGTNVLVGDDLARLRHELRQVLASKRKPARVPPLWDGHAAERIAGIIAAA